MSATLGLVVNPLAGIGGRVGLKGSDGAETVRRALALGAEAEAADKAVRALRGLAGSNIRLRTGPGDLGESACRAASLPHEVVPLATRRGDGGDTTALLAALGPVDLLLFSGGDGTARLVAAGAEGRPILGIPAGVKMYSAVFAPTPAEAGRMAAAFLARPPSLRRSRQADVLDLDEAALREGRLSPRLHAGALVPADAALPAGKASPRRDEEADVAAAARALARDCAGDDLLIVGPGTTTAAFLEALGIQGTLLGVDAVAGGRLLVADAGEAALLQALDRAARPRIVVGVLGGLGALFGRGNRQISPAVIARVGRPRIAVLGGAAKLARLPHLFVDTGDAALDRALAGHWRIATAPRREQVVRVLAADP